MFNTSYDSKCKHFFLIDTDLVLCSYPPQYTCICKHCGKHQYIFCHELEDKVRNENYKVMNREEKSEMLKKGR